jgi:hypothetical protein
MCVFVHSRFIENPTVGSSETNPCFFRGGGRSVTPTIDGICRISCIHHASSPRPTFNAGIHDATHEALIVLCNEKAQTL